MERAISSMTAGLGPGDGTRSPRLLVALGGVGLLAFEVLYRILGEPSGPLGLRLAIVGLCGAYVLLMQTVPALRRHAHAGAAAVAVVVTAENVLRMHLVDFTFTHAMPMLVVLAGCSYAFRRAAHMAAYLLGSSLALTVTMVLTPGSEVSPPVYVGTLWIFSLLTLLVFGTRLREHERVRDQERLLAGVFDGAFGGLLLLRGDGYAPILANDRSRELLRAETPGALRSALSAALARQLRVPESRAIRSAVEAGPWNDEVPFDGPDGRAWLDVGIRPVELAGASMVLVGLHDVTERRRALAAVARSELFLERSQRIGAIGSWDLDLESRTLTWSPELFRIYGLEGRPQPSVDEALALLDGESERRCRQALRRAARFGERVELDLRARTDGRDTVWLRMTGEVMAFDGGRHLLGITQDVTADRRAEQQLVTAKEVAEEALRVRSAFLANVSHEIRTPLNGIIGMTSLLFEGERDPQQRELLETIRVSGESLLRLINDLLDFSRIDAGRVDLEAVPFPTEGLFAGALEPLAAQAAAQGVELTLEVDDAVPRELVGDVTRLRQVLVNLVHNAVKFTEVGTVAVHAGGARLPEDRFRLELRVVDTGIGIPDGEIDRLFAAFVQQDASTTRRFGGTGLGLSICQRLVQLMGGTIDARSRVGEGTAFSVEVSLPVPPGAAGVPEPGRVAGLRILLLEPWTASRDLLAVRLRRWGAHVVPAADGAEARDRLAREPFAVLLADQEAATELGPLPEGTAGTPRRVLIAAPGDPAGGDARVLRPVRPTALLEALVPGDRGASGDEAGGPTPGGTTASGTAAPATAPEAGAGIGAGPPDPPGSVCGAGPAGVAPARPGPGLRVLVAEDNPVNQKVASRMLARLGCVVDIVGDGLAAVAAVQNRTYDAVLMDVQMPVANGVEATRRIRALEGTPQPRVIALTANAMAEDRARCLAAGMDAFLAKPITMATLSAALGVGPGRGARRAAG